jgi:hypothetical protein
MTAPSWCETWPLCYLQIARTLGGRYFHFWTNETQNLIHDLPGMVVALRTCFQPRHKTENNPRVRIVFCVLRTEPDGNT